MAAQNVAGFRGRRAARALELRGGIVEARVEDGIVDTDERRRARASGAGRSCVTRGSA